ncbi:PAS domain S-box [Desulfocapsa sulfexigens DSM 10523]|uniref:PAS domain S-box n=1 Tax=Desulfocapsa sulfexigens (strain DSM 10523 / SB164P1) TaxID=1167006 RepID=M1NFT6_DESSD|nr:sigma-54-dependent Fis family transcriptional regulator [Desulfocapsa sulfexigens]AGF78499.1 PAS domain S-box [Desulfocapsa sulfexigens DSM 10523]
MKIESVLQSVSVFGELLNGIPHGIAILGTDLCILTMNRYLEAMTGYSTDEARGVYGDFILRTNLGIKNQICAEVLKSGESVSIDGNIINRRRKKIPVHFTISRLHDGEGQPSGVLFVLEDSSVVKVEELSHREQSIRSKILGHSSQMENVFELMTVLARTDASVLITGETGTGKDLMAEALHKSSQRARQPFIKVNCGALPEALLESELFGHVKGAFTGAVNETAGMFRLAHLGTIFLTEIGDLSLPLQVKLLSVLDDKEFFPVGGSKKVKVDVRIIAATHRSLREEVQQGRFREDLFYRLNVLCLHSPPLRERDGDIRLLLDHFLRQFNAKLGREVTDFSPEAIDFLNQYRYPGNVRELRNIAEYSANICQGRVVEVKDLPAYLFRPAVNPEMKSSSAMSHPLVQREEAVAARVTVPAGGTTPGGWVDVEKEMILDALRSSGGNRSKASEILGWGRTTLWRKLKKYKMA